MENNRVRSQPWTKQNLGKDKVAVAWLPGSWFFNIRSRARAFSLRKPITWWRASTPTCASARPPPASSCRLYFVKKLGQLVSGEHQLRRRSPGFRQQVQPRFRKSHYHVAQRDDSFQCANYRRAGRSRSIDPGRRRSAHRLRSLATVASGLS